MYQAHFGLKKALFDGGIAQDAAVFSTPNQAEIAANCKLALMTSDATVVLTGPAGVGKTTLLSAVLRNTSTKLALGWITVAPSNAAELLELLLVELGFNAHRVGRVERMQMWRQFVNEMSATSSRVYVIAERADDLSAEVLRALDSLTAADPNGSLGANLVLLGQPALLDTLKSPLLASLRQRIRLRQRLEPFTADELRAYLEHHAKLAGSQLDKLFAGDAIAALHELSGGIPRVANNLCETALTLAATRKERLVTAEVLRHIATNLFGIAPTPTTQPAAGAPATSESPTARMRAAVRRTSTERPFAAPSNAPTEDSARVPFLEPVREPPPPEPLAAASPERLTSAPVAKNATEPPAARASAETPARPSPEPPAAAPPIAAPVKPAPVAASATVPPPSTPAAVAATPPPSPPATTPPPRSPGSSRPVVAGGPPDVDLDAFADTLTDSPDVPMLDFPVLTDAVDAAARARARPDTAYVKPPTAPAAAKAATPVPRVVAPASAPQPPLASRAPKPAQPAPEPAQAAPVTAAVKPTPTARPAPPARPAPTPDLEEEDALPEVHAALDLTEAKSIDDISDTMAETLFGDVDLDMLSALNASGFSGDDEPTWTPAQAASTIPATGPARAPTPAPKPAAPAEEDPFAFLGLGNDAPLELIDDPKPTPEQRKGSTRGR